MEKNQLEEGEKEGNVTPKSSNIMLWTAVVAIVAIAGVVYFARRGKESPTNSPTNKATPAESSISDDHSTKVFEISGKPFEFSVKEIRVKKGDRVRINFTSAQGMHNWVVDEFNAKTKVVQAGEGDSVEFLADKAGTFEYYCSVPTHRQQGMVGKLIVE